LKKEEQFRELWKIIQLRLLVNLTCEQCISNIFFELLKQIRSFSQSWHLKTIDFGIFTL